MEAIFIPQLAKAPNQTEQIEVRDYLLDLKTLTPVQGSIRVTHRGNYLEVTGHAETIMTLTCDRCLQQYNHRLSVDAFELIWLEEQAGDKDVYPLEREVALEDLVETLSPQGYFKPDEWLYEHLCLEIPQKQQCDKACSGIQTESSKSVTPPDGRWASLETLRDSLPG